jgi:spectinomycin phosphotransferase
MRARPEGLADDAVLDALRAGWEFDAQVAEHVPVGGGSYHWEVTDATGLRCFATVDDLTRKAWLGTTGDETFAGLQRALDTALALSDAGLGFVVAPLRTRDGESLRRLDSRYGIALYPFVSGEVGQFGRFENDEHRGAVISMLAELHNAGGSPARVVGFELPGLEHLEGALRELDVPWSGGPLSEPARAAVADAASELTELLALSARLAAEAQAEGGEWVITHGEPHAGNILRTSDGWRLVDWDTVAIAPRERDLWMPLLGADDELADLYGKPVSTAALDFFRLAWDLKDLAEYLVVFRSPHEENADTVRQLQALTDAAAIRDQWD